MDELRIAICDDELFYIEQIAEHIVKLEQRGKEPFHITRFQSGEELLAALEADREAFHLIFLDIEMPGLSGMEAAKKIRQLNETLVLCFVTSYEAYALKAFELEAVDYVVKPVSEERIKKTIHKALIQTFYTMDVNEIKKRYVNVVVSRTTKVIDSNYIIYIEKQRNKCVIHMVEEDIECYESLESILEKMDQTRFMFCHQGYIIDFSKVKEIKGKCACMGKGIEIPISRKYIKDINERYEDTIYRLGQKGFHKQ